jgi:hypothetical protein
MNPFFFGFEKAFLIFVFFNDIYLNFFNIVSGCLVISTRIYKVKLLIIISVTCSPFSAESASEFSSSDSTY